MIKDNKIITAETERQRIEDAVTSLIWLFQNHQLRNSVIYLEPARNSKYSI